MATIEFEELFERIREIAKREPYARKLERLIKSPDAGRVEFDEKIVEAGVYIPENLPDRIRLESEIYFPAIVGDNGDGKTTLLKALAVILRKEGAGYHTIFDKISSTRPFIDAIDEALVYTEDGSIVLRPELSSKISELIAAFTSGRLSRGPVFSLTLGALSALFDLRPDMYRRVKTVIDLKEYRRYAFDFIFKRDLAFYAFIYGHEDKAFRLYEELKEEPENIDVKRRSPGVVNNLYQAFFEKVFSSDPESIYEGLEEKFADGIREILRGLTTELTKSLEGIETYLEDNELVVITKGRLIRISIHIGLNPGDADLNIVASTRPLGDFRVPLSLAYLIANDQHYRSYFFRYFKPLKIIILEVASKLSQADVYSSFVDRAIKVLERLIEKKRDPNRERFKSFREYDILSIDKNIDVSSFIEFINNSCGGLISGPDKGRYKFEGNPRECLETLRRLARGRR